MCPIRPILSGIPVKASRATIVGFDTWGKEFLASIVSLNTRGKKFLAGIVGFDTWRKKFLASIVSFDTWRKKFMATIVSFDTQGKKFLASMVSFDTWRKEFLAGIPSFDTRLPGHGFSFLCEIGALCGLVFRRFSSSDALGCPVGTPVRSRAGGCEERR